MIPRNKFANATWELKNKFECSLDPKKNLIKNEIVIKAFEDDSDNQEIILNEIYDYEIKNEISLHSNVSDKVRSDIEINISENDSSGILVLNNNINKETVIHIDDTALRENISLSISNIDENVACRDEIMLISDPLHYMNENLMSKDKERIIVSSDPLTEINEILSLEESSENVLCSSYKSFQDKIANYEVDSYTKYVIIKTRGSFTYNDDIVLPKRFHWWNGGKLHGIPYMIIATRYLSCRFGASTHAKSLEKYNKEQEKKHKLGLCKRYKRNGTRKLGCPVKIIAHRILIFPDLKDFNYSVMKKCEKDELRQKIHKNFQNLRYENRYTCVLPDVEDHKYHTIGPSNEKEPMDKRILGRIKMLVNSGKMDPDDIAENLDDFAQMELNVSDRNRRRFYPSRLDILYAVNRAKMKIRCSDIEQEKINSMTHNWGGETELFFRQMRMGDRNRDNSTFLLVFQSQEMKRLFRLYGNNAVFIDAIHRTCEHVWPIFFLVVNTNVNYQVVGFFITQHESKEIIKEALEQIKSWNPDVNPKYGVVNRPWEEIKGLEQVYPDIQVFLSSYHRNLAWEKKVSRRENNGVNRAEVLRTLRGVADAANEEQLKTAFVNLKESKSYNSSSAKHYYETTWHFQLKRWAAAYWPSDLFFEINNGNQRLGKDLNYDYLSHIKRDSLSLIIDLLIKNYLPENLKFYRQTNLQISLNINSNHSPSSSNFFYDYAPWVVDYLSKIHFEASQCSEPVIEKTGKNQYMVQDRDGNSDIEIFIEPDANFVTCSCSELNQTTFICKHIILVGLKYPELHIFKISNWLFRDPIFHLDNYYENLTEEPVHQNDDFAMVVNYDHPEGEVKEKDISIINKHKLLQSKCDTELKRIKLMTRQLTDERLKEFYTELKNLRKSHSRCVRLENNFYSGEYNLHKQEEEESDSSLDA